MSSNLKYYTEDTFGCLPDDVFHGFFTRIGGVSQPPYEGLNCGIGSDDNRDCIMENRTAVATQSGVSVCNLLSLYQIHSATVLTVDEPWGLEERPQADGFVTDVPGIGLGILTADCAPILFLGQKENGAPVIGAAHAGWKGALAGVLENTVIAMTALGASKESIRACVGPCISKLSYEVSVDFIESFIEENEESEKFFQAGSNEGHAMFDLSGYCAWRLFRAGLKSVALMDIDTYGNEYEFYSYRRGTHRDEKDYGRQISVVSIREN